jgi:hypothetical protein
MCVMGENTQTRELLFAGSVRDTNARAASETSAKEVILVQVVGLRSIVALSEHLVCV